MDEAALARFVAPYYARRDAMHDLSHIRRFLRTARSISKKYPVDGDVLTCAAYFHGVDKKKRGAELIEFMASQGLTRNKALKILHVTSESHKESKPETVEGKILHDAHLVVGGKSLMVANFLVTGALRGFPIAHTINYFEKEVDGRFRCYLPETRKKYAAMEKFARRFFRELKRSL